MECSLRLLSVRFMVGGDGLGHWLPVVPSAGVLWEVGRVVGQKMWSVRWRLPGRQRARGQCYLVIPVAPGLWATSFFLPSVCLSVLCALAEVSILHPVVVAQILAPFP